MASYGITLTQLAKYSAMISAERNEEFTVFNQEGFYKCFCAAQDFKKLLGEDKTINNIETIDYAEWKMRVNEVQRSSTPLFGSRDIELLAVPFEKENAALLVLMGQAFVVENDLITMNKSAEAIDYSEWEMRIHEVQRSSTPLLDSREPEMLVVQFEKKDAALFILMGHRIIATDY